MSSQNELQFHQFLAEGNIICQLNAENSSEAISELCMRLAKNNAMLEPAEVVDAVMTREKVAPTVISPGLAVPHARFSNLKQLLVALGTSIKGIDFNAPGMPPVNVIILILTPKDDPGLHLQLLAALARDFKNPEVPRKVAALENAAELIDFFSKSEGEIPEYLRAMDVMNRNPITLNEGDTLHTAIETFAIHKLRDIPVVDEEGDLRGLVSLEDVLKLSLPEHLLWMDDLTPIRNFQPFAELLRDDDETKLADFMREDYTSVEEGVPAIQLAKIFLMRNIRQIMVTREKRLMGVVDTQAFITKLFWA